MKGAKQQCVCPTVTRTVLGEGTRVPPTVSALLLRTGWRGRAVWSGVGTQTGLSGASSVGRVGALVPDPVPLPS